MVADVVDEVKLETGRDLTSLLFSMVTTTTKIGQAITISIVLPDAGLLRLPGPGGALTTRPQAIFVLEMMYVFVPITLVWFGGAMLFGYKLDATRHAEIRAGPDGARVRRRGGDAGRPDRGRRPGCGGVARPPSRRAQGAGCASPEAVI